jgi:hypothetical protein
MIWIDQNVDDLLGFESFEAFLNGFVHHIKPQKRKSLDIRSIFELAQAAMPNEESMGKVCFILLRDLSYLQPTV